MREIEIKARISNKGAIQAKLESFGLAFGKPIKQHDVVYGQRETRADKWGKIWLRIRIENDEAVIFTLKTSVIGHLDSIEHEVEVSSSDELEAIIQLLGFELYSDLTKIRLKGRLGDTEVCLDSVPHLGNFIEAEKLLERDADHDKVVNELWNFFDQLGITKTDEVHEGYDIMLRKKLKVGA
jgi:predicted adenylyl cyclase CyaB